MEVRGQQVLFEAGSTERKQSLVKRAAKVAGQNLVKGMFWGTGFAVVVGPVGFLGLQHLENSTSELKTSVDHFSQTVGTGIPQIGDKIGALDNTARNFIPSTTTTTVRGVEATPTTTEQVQNSPDQVAAAGPVPTSTSTTTTTAVAGR